MPKLIKSKSLNLKLKGKHLFLRPPTCLVQHHHSMLIFLGHFCLIIAPLCHLPEAIKTPVSPQKGRATVPQLLLPPPQIRPFTPHPFTFRPSRLELSHHLLELCVPGDDGSPQSSLIVVTLTHIHTCKGELLALFFVISTFVPTLLCPRMIYVFCVASKTRIKWHQSFVSLAGKSPQVRSAYLLVPHAAPLSTVTHQPHLQDGPKRVLTCGQP